jgi:CRP/FNR family transcriptional regulator, cyclic AMP receptor protein
MNVGEGRTMRSSAPAGGSRDGSLSPQRWPLLAVLDDADAGAFLDQVQPRSFRRGQAVLHEGASATCLYLIDDGHAAVRVVTPDGDTAMIRVLGPGQHFGELALLSPGARTAGVDALDDLSVLVLDRATFDRLRRLRPQLEAVITEALVQEVRRLTHCLTEAYHLPATARVTLRLVELAGVYGSGLRDPVTIPLTQEELAQLTGATRPTVNRVLRALEDDGLIEHQRGRLLLLDVDALAGMTTFD